MSRVRALCVGEPKGSVPAAAGATGTCALLFGLLLFSIDGIDCDKAVERRKKPFVSVTAVSSQRHQFRLGRIATEIL